MAKRRTRLKAVPPSASRTSVEVQISLPLLEALGSAEAGFFELCVTSGMQVLGAMMEQDREALCGPRYQHDPDRSAIRAGTTRSEVTLGGRRVVLRRPRVRGAEGEMQLPSFAFASARDPLEARTLEAIAAGVSTRSYDRTLDPLPATQTSRATSRSAVSRRFVALSTARMREWLARPLGELDLWVIMIDGISFKDHTILVAMGIDSGGNKHVLGAREGTTENSAVTQALLRDLITRGVPDDRAMLFIIDGGTGIRKAIRKTYGPLAVVQRCQVHKQRNILEHLPVELHANVKAVLKQAYGLADCDKARRQLQGLARKLEQDHPGAAASVEEGLDDTLTLQRLGVTGALHRTLRSTNAIENTNGSIAHYTRNVRRWRDGKMILRWVVSALVEAQQGFNRIKGFRDMNKLIRALKAYDPQQQLDKEQDVA